MGGAPHAGVMLVGASPSTKPALALAPEGGLAGSVHATSIAQIWNPHRFIEGGSLVVACVAFLIQAVVIMVSPVVRLRRVPEAASSNSWQ
jgi:hypothetical protein